MNGGKPSNEELVERAARVELLVLDVDGVLTDGGMYYGSTGEALKRFDVKDGHSLVMARLTQLKVAWLSARSSPAVEARARELRITSLIQGERYKRAALEKLLAEVGIAASACAYMGDDLNDLPPLAVVGLPACPADAVLEVRQQALFIAQNPGGRGAVRELVELCLRASGRWATALGTMKEAYPSSS